MSAIDGVDRVVDGTVDHRQVNHGDGWRLAEAGRRGPRRIPDRVDGVDVPFEDHVRRVVGRDRCRGTGERARQEGERH